MASVVLCVYWLSFFVASCIFAGVHFLDVKLPQLVKDALFFGKMKDKRRKWTVVQWFEIPKSWFVHFYIAGFLVNGCFCYLCLSSYIFHTKPPAWLVSMLHHLNDHDQASIEAGSAMLLLIFMFLQNCRRLLECLFVSVYSRSTINIIHYVMGISLYILFPLSVLCEAPDLETATGICITDDLITFNHIAGGMIFIFASWQQNIIHRQFAALRKDEHGNIKTLQHKIPEGGWFQYVSCPHYLMELAIYFSFIVIAGSSHITLWTVFLFVFSNQLLSAIITHSWYRNTYKGYPRHRKAIIPYFL